MSSASMERGELWEASDWWTTVSLISYEGMTDMCHVHSDLMCTSGFGMELDETPWEILTTFEYCVARLCCLSAWIDYDFCFVCFFGIDTEEGSVNSTTGRVRYSWDNSMIGFVYFSSLEEVRHFFIGYTIEAWYDDSRGISIDTMSECWMRKSPFRLPSFCSQVPL